MLRFLAILCCAVPVVVFGQGAVVFENHWQQCNSKITVSVWKAGREIRVATDSITGNSIRIALPDSVRPGLLKIVLQGYCPLSSCEVVYSGREARFGLKGNPEQQPLLEGDPETEYYWNSSHAIDSLRNRVSDLGQLLALFRDDEDLRTILTDRYDNAVQQTGALFDRIKADSQFPVADALLSSRDYPIPPWNLSSGEKRIFIRENFFRTFDIHNPVFRRSPYFSEKVIDYLELGSRMDNGSNDSLMILGVDRFIGNAAADDTLLSEIAGVMRPWLLSKGYDAAAEYLDIQFLSGQCSAGQDLSLQARLNAYRLTAKGNRAPEIVWVQENGQFLRLADLKGEHTLVVFWASWCQHCMETLPAVFDYTSRSGIPVVAIALDQDEAAWNKAIAAFPGWVNLRAQGGWDDPWVKLFGVYGTPTIFVLDKDKIILGKVTRLEDLKILTKE